MISFECDYLEGCHPKILTALRDTNFIQEPGYGFDSFTESAKEKIRTAVGKPEAEIFFLNGGTQTNQLVIDSMLESYEGVLAAETGHVSVHEAGAIEFSGHKVLTLPQTLGKISVPDVKRYLECFFADENHDHMVFPGMLYISHPTEYGTLYTAEELKALSALCHTYDLPLFIDGARLGYGLAAEGTDVTLPLLGEVADVFYIGGTKLGALCGEAVVFPRGNLPQHFLTRIKQHGALLAKGRVLGVQFDTLFTDDLYWKLGCNGVTRAREIRSALEAANIPIYIDSPTNQQFAVLTSQEKEVLSRFVRFGTWEQADEEHWVVRFAASWATTTEQVEELRRALRNMQEVCGT